MAVHLKPVECLSSDHYSSLNRVQRRKNIRWHQAHPKKPVDRMISEPKRFFPVTSGDSTFEHVIPPDFQAREFEEVSYRSSSKGVSFTQILLVVLAATAIFPAVSGNTNQTSLQNISGEESLIRVRRGIRFPIFPRIPRLQRPRIRPPQKSPVKTKPKTSHKQRSSQSSHRDLPDSLSSRMGKKSLLNEAKCVAKMVAVTQATEALKGLVLQGKEFVLSMRNETLSSLSMYADQFASIANETYARSLNLANETYARSLNIAEEAQGRLSQLQLRVDQLFNETATYAFDLKEYTTGEIDRAKNYILFGAITKEALLLGASALIPIIQIICAQRNNRLLKRVGKRLERLEKTLVELKGNSRETTQRGNPEEAEPLVKVTWKKAYCHTDESVSSAGNSRQAIQRGNPEEAKPLVKATWKRAYRHTDESVSSV